MKTNQSNVSVATEMSASVYCPICTHTVQAAVLSLGKNVRVKPHQRCSRCSASLDAGKIMWLARAA